MVGSALVVLIVALFLPWYSSTASIAGVAVRSEGDGPAVHSYLWVVLVLAVVGVAVLVGRDALARVPGNLPSPGQLLVLVSGLALALNVLAFVSKPASSIVGSLGSGLTEKVTYNWSFGGPVAIAVALVALIAAFITSGPLQEASRAANAVGPATG